MLHIQTIKLQSAMEYLMSYGWAILIIAVVIAVMFELGLFNGPPIGNTCIGSVGFSCQSAIFTNGGYLHFELGQATGHTIYINGIACSQNTSANGYPMYGNIGVTPNGNIDGYATISGNSTYLPYTPGYDSNYIELQSGSYTNVSVPCYDGINSIAQLPLGQVFKGTIWLNYSTVKGYHAPYYIVPVTAKLIEHSDENNNGVTFETSSSNGYTLSVSTGPGQILYICAASAGEGPVTYTGSGNVVSSGNYYNYYFGLNGVYSFIATQTSNNCGASTTGPPLDLAVIGLNSNKYTLYQTGTPSGSGLDTLQLQYTVTNPNSYVVIVASTGWQGILSDTIPSGCGTLLNNYGNGAYETVYAATCTSMQPGTYNVIINTGNGYPGPGGIAISAFVYNSLN